MRQVQLIIILLSIVKLGMAQEIRKEIFVGSNMGRNQYNLYALDQEKSIYRELDNDLTERKTYNDNFLVESKFKSKLGFNLGGSLLFKLSNHFSLKSGIEFKLRSFKIENNYRIQSSQLVAVDTFNQVINGNTLTGCDNFNNTNKDAQLEDQHQLWTMEVPLQINYHITDKILDAYFGAVLSTPLFSKYNKMSVELLKIEDNGETDCSYEHVNSVIRSRSILNQLNLGVVVGVSYYVTDNLKFNFGIKQFYTNIYNEKQQGVFGLNNNLDPLDIFVHFAYVL